tara:strand:+ start:28726 stop:29415 length:690 start_codon:yes stop_codon:yes gene_type:complete
MMSDAEKTFIFFSHLSSVEDHLAYGDKQFYLSLFWQHENRKKNTSGLSSSQLYHLERLYNKYSMEEIKKKQEFEQNYSDDHRNIAVKCANYYANQYPPYFDGIVEKVLKDPQGHVLSYNEYNKMCNNKYAKKILACYEEEVKYKVGDFVQIRCTNRVDIANTNQKDGHRPRRSVCASMANKMCMILEVNAKPITRAAKGARLYKVLVTDEARPIYAHESDLKRVRGKNK